MRHHRTRHRRQLNEIKKKKIQQRSHLGTNCSSLIILLILLSAVCPITRVLVFCTNIMIMNLCWNQRHENSCCLIQMHYVDCKISRKRQISRRTVFHKKLTWVFPDRLKGSGPLATHRISCEDWSYFTVCTCRSCRKYWVVPRLILIILSECLRLVLLSMDVSCNPIFDSNSAES